MPEDVADYEAGWQKVRSELRSARRHMARWRELVPFYASELFRCLLEAGKMNANVWSDAFAGTGITEEAPVVLPGPRKATAVVWYWSASVGLLRAVRAALTDWLKADGLDELLALHAEGDERLLGMHSDYRPESELASLQGPLGIMSRISAAYRGLSLIFNCLEWFAHIQWKVASIVGELSGRDDVRFHWYDFATRYQWQKVERVGSTVSQLPRGSAPVAAWLARIRGPLQRSFRWEEVIHLALSPKEDFDRQEPWVLAERAVRYLLDGESFDVPVVSFRPLLHPDAYDSFRLIVNNPHVPLREMMSAMGMVSEARVTEQLRRDLDENERAFVRAVIAAREKASVGDRTRAPANFWRDFQRQWNKSHAKDQMSVNCMRVRYHRLSRRMRESSQS